MKSLLIKISVMALVIAGIAAFVIRPGISSADPVVYTVTGHAFSDMPDASDQNKPTFPSPNHYGGRGLGWIAMKGSNYSVTLNPTTGAFGGYGWNEFGGYVEFAPTGLPGASVDPACLAEKTQECPVSGFIRFVSHVDPQSGGWDGQVKMSDTSWITGVKLGKEIAGVRSMSGYAWGGDVAGWIDFSQVKVTIATGCTDPSATNYNPDATIDDGSCLPSEAKDCKIVGDPKYNPDPLVGEDNTKCQCPNGDYNAATGQCGNLPPICPTPAPETNYPTMPGYNSLCPIVCKKPLVLNTTTQVCELINGDQCPTTKVSNPLNPINGQNDPQTTGIENPIPAGYTLIGNKCGIPGCGVSYAKNFDNNTSATIDICDYCPKGSKWNTTTKQCEICSDPKAKECNPPKGFISPILKEV